MKYLLDLQDKKSLDRIKKLFDSYYQIMKLQNEDSIDSMDGGACVYYKVSIDFEEVWI